MKKKPQHSSRSKAKSVVKAKPLAKPKEARTLGPPFFEKFETFAANNEKWLMWAIFGLSVICSILLFDLKFSISGDDSAYVERSYNFLHKGVYPYYQGPGYPLVLALIMKVFGFKVGVFKVFSILFYTAHVVLTWFTFRKKMPYMILIFMVGFAVVSDYMQYFASQTWSEAFYMFVQAVVLYLVMKVVSIEKQEATVIKDIKKRWYLWLGIGLAFTFLAMTKTVAIFGVAAPILYFIIQKKYRFAVYIALSVVIIKLSVDQVEKSVYGPNKSNQLEQMMYKDGYKTEQGKLDLVGFIERFGENLKTYSSIHFFRFLHVIPQNQYKLSEDGVTIEDERQMAWLVTIFITALILYSSYRIFKENKQAFFITLYTLIMCGGIFFGIHASNRQDRLIIILFPFILMILGYGGYLTVKNFRIMHGIIAAILGIILLTSFYQTLAKAPESITTLQKNMGTDPRYGYTQDFLNYLEMGDWCVENLPANSMVLCRKSEIMFTSTWKQMWCQIYKIDTKKEKDKDGNIVKDKNGNDVEVQITDGDYWLKKIKDAKVTHVLVADIRAISTRKSNRLISTIHKIGSYIARKYPNKIKLVKVIGTEERAALYAIDYEAQ